MAAAAANRQIYYAAAKISILHDTAGGAALPGRGFEAIQTGPIAGLMEPMQFSVTSELSASVGGPAAARRLFAPPVQALEVTAQDNQLGKEVDLVWRTNACRQLRIIRGSCPVSNGQVMISQSAVQPPASWHIGQRIRLVGWEPRPGHRCGSSAPTTGSTGRDLLPHVESRLRSRSAAGYHAAGATLRPISAGATDLGLRGLAQGTP